MKRKKIRSAYRAKLLRLARFGIVLVPAILLAVLIPFTVAMVWVWTGDYVLKTQMFVSGLWGYVLFQSVLVLLNFRRPRHRSEYFELTTDNAPELLALVEEVRSTLNAPQIDRVLLIPDANAFASQAHKAGSGVHTATNWVLDWP